MRTIALLVAILWTLSAGAQEEEYMPFHLTPWVTVDGVVWTRMFVEGNLAAPIQAVADRNNNIVNFVFNIPCTDIDDAGNDVPIPGNFQIWTWVTPETRPAKTPTVVGCDEHTFPVVEEADLERLEYVKGLVGIPPYREWVAIGHK